MENLRIFNVKVLGDLLVMLSCRSILPIQRSYIVTGF